jgi:hypothetical protein
MIWSDNSQYLSPAQLSFMLEVMSNGKSWIAKIAEHYQTDKRREIRLPAQVPTLLAGPFGSIYATGENATRHGMGVISPEPLPKDSLVFVKLTTLGLMGFANVRHCGAKDGSFLLGLEFREGLSRDREHEDEWRYQQLGQDAAPRKWDEPED